MDRTCVKCGRLFPVGIAPPNGICPSCERAAALREMEAAAYWARLARAKEARRAVRILLESGRFPR